MSKKKVWERIGHDRVSYLNQLVSTLHLRTSTRKIARQNFNSKNMANAQCKKSQLTSQVSMCVFYSTDPY